MSVASEMVDYVDSQIASLTVSTNLFDYRMPPTPTECVAIAETGGMEPLQTLGPSFVWERPRVQVSVRSATFADARILARDIWTLFRAFQPQSLGGVAYKHIIPLQSPFLMSMTEEDYPVFGFNLQVEKDFS